jgi:flavin reductase (DIM6/NTAB) family NADH-FMN oxidoreductase RutF
MNAPLDQFLSGMRRLAGGVCVVTTAYEGLRYGLTATSVCSLSVSPPSVLICVNRDAESHAPICKARVLCVNILSATQGDIANRFGGANKGPERFNGIDWETSESGVPRLAGCLSSFDCDVAQISECKTHSIFICIVRSVTVDDGAPLIYWQRQFHSISPTAALV